MRTIALMMLCLALISTTYVRAEAYGEDGQRFIATVMPEMELLAGVLTQTSWIRQRGPTGEGNEYYRALKDFFKPYKNHEAVKIAQELTDLGFTYDAPPGFICHLGSLPELELRHEYSAYLVNRAKGRERLERFRIALRDLAHESRFEEFIAQWQPSFDTWVNKSKFDGARVVAWLEDFFGKEADEFHLILAPAMFPGGGYGPSIQLPDGGLISYQIVRESGTSRTAPEFPAGSNLESLSLHEWGHSFVNPAIDKYPTQVQGLKHLFDPVQHAMRQQAYSSVGTYINEQVLRAVTALAMRDLYGEDGYLKAIEYEKSRSFMWTKEIADMLTEYRSNREAYPTFDDFVPILLTKISELLPRPQPMNLEVLGGVAVLLLLVVFVRRRYLQKG